MFTKKLFFLIVIIIFIIFAFYYASIRFYSLVGNRIIPLDTKNGRLYVEIVSNQEKREKGLGGRDSLCLSCGMLFEFQKVGKYSFWMKDMRFPLDIVWLAQNKVVHIEKNIQANYAGTLTPNENADTVLEINAGMADKIGLSIGDEISF